MSDHKRLANLLRLIRLLNKPGGYSVERLANRFHITPRSVYRYFNTLRECGFEMEKVRGRYRFANSHSATALFPLLTEDEATLLRDAVLAIRDNRPYKTKLIKKLNLLGNPGHIAEMITDHALAGIVKTLMTAIREQRRVVLCGYQSPSSDTVRNRLVEPLGFSINLRYLHAWETEQETVLQFKPERIEHVRLTEHSFKIQKHHRIEKPDLFGMNGEPKCRVTLRLNRRAANLLMEEFPESREYLPESLHGLQTFGRLEAELDVRGFEGAGRFVLGLPGEAEPLGPPAFLRYLQNRIRQQALYSKQGVQ